jgi:tRNA threonylcarbamoyladenosine biosynthesis protein TsaE
MMERIFSEIELPSVVDEFLNTFSEQRLFLFHGNVGAGKTTFIKALCRKWEVEDNVQSPTYGLVNTYVRANGKEIHHFDLYRTKDEQEIFHSGISEYLDTDGICLVEWPKNIVSFLAENFVEVFLEHHHNRRKLRAQICEL